MRHPHPSRLGAAIVLGAFLLASIPASGYAQWNGTLQPRPADDPAIERRVDSLLALLTTEEKIELIAGVNVFDVPGNARIGLPRLGTADGPFGVRSTGGPGHLYAGGIGLAATWNTPLAERVGVAIGRDARARGKHYWLGPGVNMYRAPLNGRNFEYYGEDPWLASRVAVAVIRGVQSQGVAATIKHFVGNESEYLRHNTDSRIDERTLREIYLPPFEAAVKEADVGAIMPSYNYTNGFYMTANRSLLVDLAKNEWAFRGVMMSDWTAVHSTLGAATGGTDLEMPGPAHFNRDSLLPLLRSGAVTPATLDDKVRRLLRTAARFRWLDRPAVDPTIPRYHQDSRALALQSALEAMVLLKNERILPLDRSRSRTVALIGPNAHPAVMVAGGSATVLPFNPVSALEGVSDFLGANAAVLHARGVPSLARMAALTRFATAAEGGQPGVTVETFDNTSLAGTPTITQDFSLSFGRPLDLSSFFTSDDPDLAALFGGPKVQSVRRTGWYTAPAPGTYELFVQQGGFNASGARLYVDDRKVIDSWDAANAELAQASLPLTPGAHKIVLEYRAQDGGFGSPFARVGIAASGAWVDSAAVQLAARADAAILTVGFDAAIEGEGWDREFSLPPGQDALIRAVAAANRNTIVVINAGGAVDMTGWIDRVGAVVQAWYPGEQGGRALAQLLFGDVNFSGRLPATFERRWEDNPTHDSYYPKAGTLQVPYAEGVFMGYRGYDRRATTPLFPFGHGLSYTTYTFANLSVAAAPGGTPDDPKYVATFDVTNAGDRAGSAVAQLYVSPAQTQVVRPEKELKGFAKVELRPGETRRVSLPLDFRSLAYFDAAGRQWRADAGTYTVRVGGSSADLALSVPLALSRTVTRPVARR